MNPPDATRTDGPRAGTLAPREAAHPLVPASPDSGPPPSLTARFREVRGRTEALTTGLAAEDLVVQSMEDVSPTKWHLAHTSWFWETFVLSPHAGGYEPFHPRYDYLFNSYYVQAGERHCRDQRGYLSRPTVREVMEYRGHVDEAMDRLLASAPDGGLDPELRAIVEIGLNHEQQHQELMLTDIKHVFSVNPLRPAYHEGAAEGPHDAASTAAEPRAHGAAGNGTVPTGSGVEGPGWIEFSEGVREIGWAGPGFHFDNEGPRHRRFFEPFAIADRLVTNGEYLRFMEDGGYDRAELWMSAGWAQRKTEGWTEPFYWERRDGAWWTFTLSGMRPVDPTEPVCHLNWFEAEAFARWAGARLPREDEWEVAAERCPVRGNLAESGRHHPTRVETTPTAVPRRGDALDPGADRGTPEREGPAPRQMFGDVWEWTSSAYSPYPGYRPLEGAIGEYNGKFMCGQFVLRGGSCATPASHIRRTYRNFFHPDASWQFTGLRLARDLGS